jgi:hypothetical protein
MRDESDSLISLAAGTGGAILLGMLLVPLREMTSASNLAFFFMALTIIVAEFGGGRAAVATALSSALSLDFFLTRPYLRLTIAHKHDIIAFAGLAACGLIVAAVGSRRQVRNASLATAREQLELLHEGLRRMETPGASASALTSLLAAAIARLPLVAAVVRDEHGEVLATAGRVRAIATPAPLFTPESVVPRESSREMPPIPGEGSRIALRAQGRPVGWLDVWGNGRPADRATLHTLAAVGRIAASMLASASPTRSVLGGGQA